MCGTTAHCVGPVADGHAAVCLFTGSPRHRPLRAISLSKEQLPHAATARVCPLRDVDTYVGFKAFLNF